MSDVRAVSPAGKATVVALITSAVGVAIQIAAGAPYPTVPPVFFILLIPAGLIATGRWWWAPIPAVLAGMFLTIGLFAAGETGRLVKSDVRRGFLWSLDANGGGACRHGERIARHENEPAPPTVGDP